MAGRGRPKKEDALVRDLTSVPKIASTISKDYIIPNHSGLTGNQDAKNKLDGRYVKKTGDTMSGDLTLPNLTATGDIDLAVTSEIKFENGSDDGYINFNGDDEFTIGSNSQGNISFTQTGVEVKQSGWPVFRPAWNNYILGYPSYGWAELYMNGPIKNNDGTSYDALFGSLSIDATVDHTITDSSDDLKITNNNSDKDIIFNINDAGTTHDLLTLDASVGQVLISNDDEINLSGNGIFKVTGTWGGTCAPLYFQPTMTGGFLGCYMVPILESNSSAIGFTFKPTRSGTHGNNITLMNYDLGGAAHVVNNNDTYNRYSESGISAFYFAAAAADVSTVNITPFTFGGAPITIFDGGFANVAYTDKMMVFNGGMNRAGGTNGSVTQVGVEFKSFGTQTNAIGGTDSVIAWLADGGNFKHRYDYSATSRLEFGAGDDSSIGYDGDDLIIKSDDVGTGGILLNSLPYGEIYINDNTTATTLAAQDTWYQVTTFGYNGHSHRATPDHTNDHITILTDGKYMVNVSFSCQSAQSNAYYFEVYKNNGATGHSNLENERQTGVANKPGSVSISGIADFTAGDTIELWVKRTDGGAVSKSITLTHGSLSLFRIGE